MTRLLLSLGLCLAQLASAQRLILVTLDGLGHQIATTDEAATELSVLRDTIRAGALAGGMLPPRPALTAVSHASIWTGAGPEANGVPFNNPPARPRRSHAASSTVLGFRGTELKAEPFWVAAGRQGVKALAYQPTQGFPFTPVNTGPGATVINSYQTRTLAPYAILTPADVVWLPGGGFTFTHASKTYRAKPAQQGLLITRESGASALLPLAAAESDPPRQRELARHFRPILLDNGETGLFFRLFEYDPEAPKLRLLVSATHETGYHDGQAPSPSGLRELIRQCGPVVGNGAAALLNAGAISPAEYLETVELVIRQLTCQALAADASIRPRLTQAYLPYPDEFDHHWIARARTDPRFASFRRWGYIAVDRGMAALAAMASPQDWLIWASDHGMAEIRKSVAVGAALDQAGLGGKAVVLYNAVLLNTEDWAGGAVPLSQKTEVLAQVRKTLEDLRDPDTGQPVIAGILTDPALIPVCENCADLYFDPLPGYRATSSRTGPIVRPLSPPQGAHGFAPERADMLALFAIRGPGIAAGGTIQGMRTIDVAPFICSLLGIEPPRNASGRAPPIEIRSTP